jgi:hypothetical protein
MMITTTRHNSSQSCVKQPTKKILTDAFDLFGNWTIFGAKVQGENVLSKKKVLAENGNVLAKKRCYKSVRSDAFQL